ncbi:DUF3575 domain-containing protein [Capnocytophaga sp.]
MKKIIVAAMLVFFSVKTFAQDRQHQVNLNILNAIWLASVEVGYEHFIAENQSIEGELFFNDRFSVFPKKDGEKYNTTSLKVGYNYYFEEDGGTGLYINPFVKQRFGNFKYKNKNGEGDSVRLDSFILGIGAGYQWNYEDTFIVAPYVNIARNFGKGVNSGEGKRFWAIEPNFGIKIGYRF